jgi:hypothetical protein
MSLLAQELVVTLAVLACAIYSTWRLLSGAARLRTLELLAALPGARASRWHAALMRRTLSKLSGCAGCAANAPPSRNQTPGAPRR